MVDVTVITMTYLTDKRRLGWLKQTIESVISQEGVDFEYIIINDGSKLEIPSAWISHPRIRYVKREHMGRAKSSNYATEIGKGKYRCSVSDDDYFIGNDSLAIRFKLAEEHPKASLIWTNGYKVDENGKRIREFKDPVTINGRELAIRGGIINNSTVFINRKLWLKFKLNEKYTTGEEYDLQFRLAKWSEKNGYHFEYFPQYYTSYNRVSKIQGSRNLTQEQKKMRRKIRREGLSMFIVDEKERKKFIKEIMG